MKIKKDLMYLSLDGLRHAEWNPRTSEELDWEHPEMKSLISSVRAVGVVQPIAVWLEGSKKRDVVGVVIAGNRRLEAASAAGLKEIPAYCFSGLTEAQAREITRIENEVRLGISPLKDAELIGSMLGLKYSQKEIAAHFGVSEATICRRVKLLDLIPEIREFTAKHGNLTTDALERIALYPAESQRSCLHAITSRKKMQRIAWGDISLTFSATTRDLDSVDFETSPCIACASRTGALGDLWGEKLDKKDSLGRCLDADCFQRRLHAHHICEVRKIVGNSIELVDVDVIDVGWYYLENDDRFSCERSAEHAAAWWRVFFAGEIEILYGPTYAEYKRSEDERSARLEREREENRRDAMLGEERRKKRAELTAKLNKIDSDFVKKIESTMGDFDDEGTPEKIKNWFFGALNADQADAVTGLIGESLIWELVDNFGDQAVALLSAYPKFRDDCGITNDDIYKRALAAQAIEAFDAEEE